MTIKWLARVIASLCGAVIATLIIAAAALFVAMFSTPGEGSHRTEKLWGGVFFQTMENGNSTTLRLGVGNPWVLVGMCVAFTAFFVYISWIYDLLMRRREVLRAMQANGSDTTEAGGVDGSDVPVGLAETEEYPDASPYASE